MQAHKKALIVAGGSIHLDFLMKTVSENNFDVIVAADNGLMALDDAKIMPTHIIGDFDTAKKALVDRYMHMDCIHTVKLPENKSLTDMQAAIMQVISLDIEETYILGALGGARPDHSLVNVYLLVHFLKAGKRAYLLNETSSIFLMDKDITIYKKEYNKKYISLLPLTWQVKGITLTGMKYPLDDAVITIGESIGVSNEMTGDVAKIQIKEGILIVIYSKEET